MLRSFLRLRSSVIRVRHFFMSVRFELTGTWRYFNASLYTVVYPLFRERERETNPLCNRDFSFRSSSLSLAPLVMPLSADVSRLLVILIGSSGRNFFASFPRFFPSLGPARTLSLLSSRDSSNTLRSSHFSFCACARHPKRFHERESNRMYDV